MEPEQRCRAHLQCSKLNNILLEAGVEDEIKPCPKTDSWPCGEMIHNARILYKSVTPKMASRVIRFISELFGNVAEVFKQDVKLLLSESPFHCPDVDIDIHQPCQVDSCEFFTPNKWTRNCILYYRVRHDRDLLNLNELAFLLNSDINSLRARINKTIKTLGHGALKETIVQEGVSSQVTHLDVDKVCVVCEKSVVGKGRPIIRSGELYCSRACYKAKPPVVVTIERDFGLPIDKVLALCVDKFASVKNMCGALGIGQSIMHELCDKYGIDLSDKID